MEMRKPDLSGNCFKMSSNLGQLLIADGTETKWETSRCCYHQCFHSIYFYMLQDILQYGRSFEVEKILSDERYQTLKVSRWKITFVLLFLFWCFQIRCDDRHLPSLRDMKLSENFKSSLLSEESLSFQSMSSWLRPYLVSCQLFTSVFGVGPKTAEKWYRRGLRSFSGILTEPSIHLNQMQQNGTSTRRPLHSDTPQTIHWQIQLEFAS